jgi:hypothetical protein
MLLLGEQVWRRRAREVLERDGTSLEGAFSSQSRWDLARGGVQPPSEAEPHPRGRPALERGGVLPVRHRAPRAKRSSARGWLGRLSGGLWARGFILWVFLGLFAFVFYEGKRVFPDFLRDPYGCPRHVATTQPMTRREDGIRGMDHSINPHNSRDAAQHTYKTRGSSSLVVQEVSLT